MEPSRQGCECKLRQVESSCAGYPIVSREIDVSGGMSTILGVFSSTQVENLNLGPRNKTPVVHYKIDRHANVAEIHVTSVHCEFLFCYDEGVQQLGRVMHLIQLNKNGREDGAVVIQLMRRVGESTIPHW